MNRVTQVSLLIIALLGGYGMGYAYHLYQQPPIIELEPTIPEPIIITNTVPSEASVQEKQLLLQAIKELDVTTTELDLTTAKLNVTTTELDNAHKQLKDQEKNLNRYNWMVEKWKEKGFGNLGITKFGWNSFHPSKNITEFFDWNNELVSKMERVGTSTATSVRDWEAQHAAYVEADKDVLTYRLPAAPEHFQKTYMEAIAAIMPAEDFEILASMLADQFNSIASPRDVTLSIGPLPENMMPHAIESIREKDWMIIRITSPEGHVNTGPTTMIPYIAGRTIPVEWNHIFELETAPNSADTASTESAE